MNDIYFKFDKEKLIAFSIDMLSSMIMPKTNLFCCEKNISGDFQEESTAKSIRYSIMSLLGLSRAFQEGYSIPFDLDRYYHILLDYEQDMSIGDSGLFLWLDDRLGGSNGRRFFDRLQSKLDTAALDSINNMELSWLIVGLTYYNASNNNDGIELTKNIFDYFLKNRSAGSGLFYHSGRGLRRNFPNFANIIYPIHALSIRATVTGDSYAGERAVQAMECLKRLQRDNGGWPWLYNAERGSVVEPFEIYSVHQDAMAPMGFFKLQEATGYNTEDIILKGYKWLFGENELKECMIDESKELIYRSIRRKYPYNKVKLYSQTILNLIGLNIQQDESVSFLEVNRTCRPYHAGWILEAWCSRAGLNGKR